MLSSDEINIKAVKPSEVDFKVDEVYYVILKGEKKVIPLKCMNRSPYTEEELRRPLFPRIGGFLFCYASDIELVLVTDNPKKLHEINMNSVWKKRCKSKAPTRSSKVSSTLVSQQRYRTYTSSHA